MSDSKLRQEEMVLNGLPLSEQESVRMYMSKMGLELTALRTSHK